MSDITVQINPPATIPVSVGGGVTAHASTHAPGASDSLEAYYATTGSLAYVSGLATGISSTGYLTGYVTKTETGSLSGVFYPLTSNPSGYVQGAVVRPSNTGAFLDTGSSQTISSLKNFTVRPTVNGTGVLLSGESAINTGVLTGAFYPLNSNPSGYITGVDLSNYVTKSSTGSFVTTGQTGNFVVSSQTGAFLTTGAADARYALQSATGSFITSSQTGQFVTTGSTGSFVTTSQTGQFVSTGATGNFVTGSVVRPSETGNFITTSQTGQFVSTGVTGNFVVSSQTGTFLTTGAADGRYYGLSNGQSISGYAITGFNDSVTGITVTGVDTKTITLFQRDGTTLTANFTDNSASGSSDTGYLTGYVSKTETGQFYPISNPSGYITGVDLSSYATTGYVTGVSGYLQNQINNSTGAYVSLTGNQDISGLKDFQTRPTVLDTPVLLSGEPVDIVHLYAKNDEPFILNKGQPVYIGGANGSNPLIKMASNTGEFSSSKTIGLLAQTLNPNDLGYVITEGALEGFDTSSGAAGDPMWLGPTGQILYGTGNKPYGLNNLVYLGVVLRSQSVNGKVYVQIQNGFEVEELHNVYALNPSNKDTLLYDSASGAWFARQITTGDVSGITNYVLQSATGVFVTSGQTGNFITTSQTGQFVSTGSTGNFVVSSQTGAFLTTGAADGRYALQSATGSFITSSQTGQFVGTGSTGNFVTTSQTGSFLTTASQYVQEIYIDAAAMLTGISGATPTGVSVLNSGVAYDCYSFDAATTGFTQFKFALNDYDLGAMKAKFHWTAPGTVTGGVVWGIQSRAVGDAEFLNSGFAGGVEVNDFFSTGTGFFTSTAASFTPSGVLASGDLFFFRVYRSVANASDDLGANAYLLGVSIQYTGNRITAW
jgi:hypothetical protein